MGQPTVYTILVQHNSTQLAILTSRNLLQLTSTAEIMSRLYMNFRYVQGHVVFDEVMPVGLCSCDVQQPRWPAATCTALLANAFSLTRSKIIGHGLRLHPIGTRNVKSDVLQ